MSLGNQPQRSRRQPSPPHSPETLPVVGASARVIRASELVTRSWGAGETTQVAIYPPASSFEDRTFDCRISQASVNRSGPFTKFPGFERHLMLIKGGGLQLTIDEQRSKLGLPYERIHFPGGANVEATLLAGSIQDFNIIFRRPVKALLTSVRLHPSTTDLTPLPLGGGGTRIDLLFSPEIDFECRPYADSPVGQNLRVNRGEFFERSLAGPDRLVPALRVTCDKPGMFVLASLMLPAEVH